MRHCGNSDCPGLARDGVVPEFRDEIARCLDCDQPLMLGAAISAADAADGSGFDFVEWKTVFIAANSGQGRLVGNAIEEEGIRVYVKGEALQGAIGELPATVSQVEVQVPKEDYGEAREIALWFEGEGIPLPGDADRDAPEEPVD